MIIKGKNDFKKENRKKESIINGKIIESIHLNEKTRIVDLVNQFEKHLFKVEIYTKLFKF